MPTKPSAKKQMNVPLDNGTAEAWVRLRVSDRCYDAELRLETVVSLACQADLLEMSEDAEKMLADFESVAQSAGIEVPVLTTNATDPFSELAELAEALLDRGFTGVFAEFAQPLFDRPGGSSWRLYCTRWFYGDSLDAAIENALTWAEARRNEAAKAGH